ncbi:MAG TPA: hypothetical protein VMS93_03580 [Candidatus Saccharimonadales bacterium]|nr:hypothetical protein [Candidatus Saccharimonadales bacterium]
MTPAPRSGGLAERVALVGLAPEALDLIHLVRERGSEVCLVADADPASRSHALAEVFRVPFTGDLAQVEQAGCDLVVVPDTGFGAGTWQARWTGAGLRWTTVADAWQHFRAGAPPRAPTPAAAEPRPVPRAEPPRPTHPGAQDAPPTGETRAMTHGILEQEIRASFEAPSGSFFPSSLRAAATHLEELLHQQRAATDAALGAAYLWDEVVGDLLPPFEVLAEPAAPAPGEWAQRWIRRAWSERRALVFQEAPLAPEGGAPHRSRALVALPVGDTGILYLEDAWLPLDPGAPAREAVARAARQWSESLAAARAEQLQAVRRRLQEGTGEAVFELLPEDEPTDPWPGTAERLARLLEADAVLFHFPDAGTVAASHTLDARQLQGLREFLGERTAEALRAMPRLAGRARTPEGQALRALGVASLLGWARGAGAGRVAVAAVRLAAAERDDFCPEHLVALKKFLLLASTLSRGSGPE